MSGVVAPEMCIRDRRYTDEQLEAAGCDPELIRTAHERIRSGELYDKANDDLSLIHISRRS